MMVIILMLVRFKKNTEKYCVVRLDCQEPSV